jgi:hypothetical protein
MLRRRSLLGRVPRDGSPTSWLLLRRSDFSCPGSLGSPPHFPFRPTAPEATRSPRFLCNPCERAPSQGPRRGRATRTPGADAPAFRSRRCCLPRCRTCRPSPQSIFRGLPPWPAHPLSTLRSRPRGTSHARLAPRPRSSALPGRDFHPWVASRGFRWLHPFLLSQASPGATAFMPGARVAGS